MLDTAIGNRNITVLGPRDAGAVLIQPAGKEELEFIEHEFSLISNRAKRPFRLVCIHTANWNDELSPWSAPPVFGKTPFGGGAAELRGYIENLLIPVLDTDAPDVKQFFIGGYSLAGLFALWCGYESKLFTGIAAVSPSVWYPGWTDFISSRDPFAKQIYLSLGDKEELARNKTLAMVGPNIRMQYDRIKELPETESIFEWNSGNHFSEPCERTAKGFSWLLESKR